MGVIELQFPVLATTLVTQAAYPLYSALSRLVPELHQPDFPVRIGPLVGTRVEPGRMIVDPRRTRLRLRLPADRIPLVLPLAGKQLDLDGHLLRLGVPQVQTLEPAATLFARLVVLKASAAKDPQTGRRDRTLTRRYMEPQPFLDAIARILERRRLTAIASIPPWEAGPRAGQPRRGLLMVKGRHLIGFPLLLEGLSAEDSLRILGEGLGQKAKMGAGWFVPAREGKR